MYEDPQIVIGNFCAGGGASMRDSPTNIHFSNTINNHITITLGGDYDDADRLKQLLAACNVSENDIPRLIVRAVEDGRLCEKPRELTQIPQRRFFGLL